MNQKRPRSRTARSDHRPPRAPAPPRPAVAFAGPRLIVKAEREKSLLRRHPWVFSGAVERIEGAPQSGDTICVCDSAGGFLAWAGYSAESQITAKVWS
jgi:23S rRNA (cytosine1962-C5)-methyltransferase